MWDLRNISGFLAQECNSGELSEQSMVCVWPGLTCSLPGSSLALLVRQHRPCSFPSGQSVFSHTFLKGRRVSLTLWAWATPTRLASVQENGPCMFNALDPSKRSHEYHPLLVVSDLSSGAL